MKINTFLMRNGTRKELGKFTVLIGPNNCGKSRLLKDIVAHVATDAPGSILIESIEFEPIGTLDEVTGNAAFYNNLSSNPPSAFMGLRPNLTEPGLHHCYEETEKELVKRTHQFLQISSGLRQFSIAYINAESRLKIATTAPSNVPDKEACSNLLQVFFRNRSNAEPELQDLFNKTFQKFIQFDYSGMKELCFRVSDDPIICSSDPTESWPILSKLQKLDEEGDGFRSFVGVVISLILCQNRTLLLDEPEGFLHPTHARALGRWIGEAVKNFPNQIIIATHSSAFLSGLLATSQDINIVRLNRKGNQTTFVDLSPQLTSNLVKNALLSSQRVHEALFHSGVVICESDSDRSLYQLVAEKIVGIGDYLFVNAQNKQTLGKVASALRECAVPTCAIADIDILNSADDLKKLILALKPGYDTSAALSARAEIAAAVTSMTDDEVMHQIQEKTAEFVEQLDAKSHNLAGAKSRLRDIASIGKWKEMKEQGISCLPAGVKLTAENLLREMKQIGLFIVPSGELESWVNCGVHSKKNWITAAMDFLDTNPCPSELQTFITEICNNLATQR